MARTAVYLHATVRAGNILEIPAPPDLKAGDHVDVVILSSNRSPTPNGTGRPLQQLINALPPNAGIFKSAAEVDRAIREERDCWDR
jgi:hypothetical protein